MNVVRAGQITVLGVGEAEEELAEDEEGLTELDVGGVGIDEELGGAGVGVDELAMDEDAIESDGVTLTGVDVVVSESVGVGETRA